MMREHDRMAMDERRHAAEPRRSLVVTEASAESKVTTPGGFGQEAYRRPTRRQRSRALGLRREVEEIGSLDGAEHDGAIGQDQSERDRAIVYLPV